jgi:hypothetical protein
MVESKPENSTIFCMIYRGSGLDMPKVITVGVVGRKFFIYLVWEKVVLEV